MTHSSNFFKIFATILSFLQCSTLASTQRDPVVSLLPVPNGPYYGFPYPAETISSRLLPLATAGTCKEGTVYNIKTLEDLRNLTPELECVFSAGLTPDKVLTGPMHGQALTIMNTRVFNFPYNTIWKGQFIEEVECNGNTTFLGWNHLLGRPLVPFVASIKHSELNLAPGEYDDRKESLIVDHTSDLKAICPDFPKYLQENRESTTIRRKTLNIPFPINHAVDLLRYVGKQDDGGSIYLGKTYVADPYRSDKQSATISFFSVVNYDSNVMKNFTPGDSLPPLSTTYKYMFPGIIDAPFRFLPIDNLLKTPVRTIGKMIRGAFKIGREGVLYTEELSRNFGSFRRNSQRFRNAFNADRKKSIRD